MISGIGIFDEQKNALITRNFSNRALFESLTGFFKIAELKNDTYGPVLLKNGSAIIFIQRDGLYFVSVQAHAARCNVMTVVVYLDQFYLLLKRYMATKRLDRMCIIDNVNLIYELLDETTEYGVPQLTEYNIVQDFIKVQVNLPSTNSGKAHNEALESSEESDNDGNDYDDQQMLKSWKRQSFRKEKKSKQSLSHGLGDDEQYINSFILRTTTQAVSWRPKGIHYAKNEFFLDVVEGLELSVDVQQKIVRKHFIRGRIQCRSYLSGMPQLKICINKMQKNREAFLQTAKFHQCVSLDNLRTGEAIELIPPDGEFLLCEYTLKRSIKDPPVIQLAAFEVTPNFKKFKLNVSVTIEPHFKAQNSTSSLNVRIPLTKIFHEYKIDLTKTPRFKCDTGTVAFNLTDDLLLWTVGCIKGGHGENSHTMHAQFYLFDEEQFKKEQEELKNSMDPPPLREGLQLEKLYNKTHRDPDSLTNAPRAAITADFEIPYYTCSRLKIEYLKIEEDQLHYQSFPWVRYKTVNDKEYAFQI
ncbi:LAMI_0F10132g1_1 [Lachancea mirantina]|uniref:LAMI_0F10132g1_1 n=1 Tax=Lachancea mirantina TaxID=1230905 RepID=A0A1G4K1K4_9SACH|nr:LAMI_0F10132g1_1 [Lachancea mirantina]